MGSVGNGYEGRQNEGKNWAHRLSTGEEGPKKKSQENSRGGKRKAKNGKLAKKDPMGGIPEKRQSHQTQIDQKKKVEENFGGGH